jgi:hypothetical protein
MTTAFKISPSLWAVIDAASVFRLTRLVTHDRLTERARQWILRRWGMPAFDFASCPWCVSVYVAAGVVALTALVSAQWKYVAFVLAFSAVAGLLADR